MGAVDSGYQAAPNNNVVKGLSDVLELVTVLWDCEAVVIPRPLTYMASDKFYLSPLTPFIFLLDVREIGVPGCGYWDAKSPNKNENFAKLTPEFKKVFLSGISWAPCASGKYEEQLPKSEVVGSSRRIY